MALTLKEGIFFSLSHHNLAISNIRGHGYNGASNMRGEWNGLQDLICNECPYAYYIHYLAHCLQLALVAASREVTPVHHFFSNLVFIINIASASCKRNDELKEPQVVKPATKTANDEIESGRGLNQIGTLKRAGDTRWEKFYVDDFSKQKLVVHLRIELQHFELDIPNHPESQNLSSIYELCQGLVKTKKATVYPLTDRLLRLVLTLPVSTTTTERAFSIMKIIKTKLRNKMEDNFLSDCLTVCIEKEIAAKFSSDSIIIDDFASMKNRRVQLTFNNIN
ncbi:uncharacterized protein LOC133798644 [Humulus lupulus]|uniref:uncharacterized protein LOC133798644 n=1 Tax=Humulus lupulus TaxID=3486 RepID=UPI002B408F82|nr:uncharacterized protein LOC133798644 [Humulus lupulus]